MNVTPAALASVLFTAGFGLAVPAFAEDAAPQADPAALGTYTFEAEDGETAMWTVTPCADDSVNCVHVASSGNDKRGPWNANAYRTVGSWILFVDQADAVACGDGSKAAGTNNYSWDAVSFNGYASINTSACGEPESVAIPFTLTRTGEAPRAPQQPVQVEPYIVDVPPPYTPPPAAAEAAPMPAEQDPAIVASPNPIPNESDPLTEAIVAEPGFNAVPGGAGEGARR